MSLLSAENRVVNTGGDNHEPSYLSVTALSSLKIIRNLRQLVGGENKKVEENLLRFVKGVFLLFDFGRRSHNAVLTCG